jgi:hypothetical protein
MRPIVASEKPSRRGRNFMSEPKQKPKPEGQHFPTAEERDERHKIEDVSPEDALKILMGAQDGELDEKEPPAR